MDFKVGDRVRWSSQAGGHKTTKEGVVVEVIKPGEMLTHERMLEIADKHGAGTRKWGGPCFASKRKRYVIRVSYPGTGKTSQLYFPRTRNLEPCPTN